MLTVPKGAWATCELTTENTRRLLLSISPLAMVPSLQFLFFSVSFYYNVVAR